MTAMQHCDSTQHSHLITDFLRYFDLKLAIRPEERAAAYRLRYQVYCLEQSFEPAERFPDEQEVDEFDRHSLHCLIIHRATGIAAGCVRVVNGGASGLLPLEMHCPGSVNEEIFQAHAIQREAMCEISRLAVSSHFRRRSSDQLPITLPSGEGREISAREARSFPLIATAGFLGATALTDLAGTTSVFALMEPFLPRLMSRAGINFQKAGSNVQYNGLRAPYFIRTEWATHDLRPELRELYQAIYASLAADYQEWKAGEGQQGETAQSDCQESGWPHGNLLGATEPAFA